MSYEDFLRKARIGWRIAVPFLLLVICIYTVMQVPQGERLVYVVDELRKGVPAFFACALYGVSTMVLAVAASLGVLSLERPRNISRSRCMFGSAIVALAVASTCYFVWQSNGWFEILWPQYGDWFSFLTVSVIMGAGRLVRQTVLELGWAEREPKDG
jgi:hypothetical protein